jgi:hypothetical protein
LQSESRSSSESVMELSFRSFELSLSITAVFSVVVIIKLVE